MKYILSNIKKTNDSIKILSEQIVDENSSNESESETNDDENN